VQNKLPKVELEILKVLWGELHSGQGFGLTRGQILARLQERRSNDGGLLVRTDAALRAHLQRLTSQRPPLLAVTDSQTNMPGGRPKVYALDRDRIITWPSTAFMLVALWKTQPVRSIERDEFIERMVRQKILNSSTGKIADENGILKQLRTSREWGYIDYINETVMLPSKRLAFELEYLEFVASHLDLPGEEHSSAARV
jgi:hypothetical protein